MSTVAVVTCDSYEQESVKSALERGLNLIPGIQDLFTAGENILVKPNLLSAVPSSKAVTTHPRVFEAVSQWLQTRGLNVSYGDSPAVVSPAKAAGKSGLAEIAHKLDIPLADFRNSCDIKSPEDSLVRRFKIAKAVTECDGIVSIVKMKTHMFTTITGAVKNIFGCVPGLHKSAFHAQFPDPDTFSRMLVDLYRTIPPRLHVVDGIVSMEGAGPGGGDPVDTRVLMISTDPVALDASIAAIMGIQPSRIPVLKWAAHYGLSDINTITYVGDPLEEFHQSGYQVPEHHGEDREKSFLVRTARNHVVQRPVIAVKRCVSCNQCVTICPVTPKALTSHEKGIPTFDYKKCIRCFCCQEVCPESAIDVKKPILGKLLYRLISKD